MSVHLEFFTSTPASPIVAELRKGGLASVKLGPVTETNRGFVAEWDHGNCFVEELDAESRDAVSKEYGLESPQSCLWLHCKPRDPGTSEAVAMSVSLMESMEGDVALAHGSGSLMFQRVKGRLTLYQNEIEYKWMPLFTAPYEVKPRFDEP